MSAVRAAPTRAEGRSFDEEVVTAPSVGDGVIVGHQEKGTPAARFNPPFKLMI